MQILTNEQYELLMFVHTCNRHHYKPTSTDVELWHDNPEPREAPRRHPTG